MFVVFQKKELLSTSDGQNDSSSQENHISCLLYDKKLVLMIVAPNITSKIHLSCPYCQENYIKQRDLFAHLVRSHQINGEDFKIELQYYCSIINCPYHVNSGKNKYFQSRKYLNQHHIKVHMDKTYHCKECALTFPTESLLKLHLKTCNITFICEVCNNKYRDNEKLLVHLMRKHPDIHKRYKEKKKNLKRKAKVETETKRTKVDEKLDFICDSPKRSFATQTLSPEDTVKNDVTLPSWQSAPKISTYKQTDIYETKTDEISTQTVFEDLLSLKSQNSEDESSIFFSETVSLSDIQTQTFPLEFGLSRSNKETITSETQSPDLSIKETQTCFCLYDSPKINLRLFDSVSSSPSSINLTSSETQTSEFKSNVKSDVMLSFNSAQTQTSFEDRL